MGPFFAQDEAKVDTKREMEAKKKKMMCRSESRLKEAKKPAFDEEQAARP
jgi:hypothetical protein